MLGNMYSKTQSCSSSSSWFYGCPDVQGVVDLIKSKGAHQNQDGARGSGFMPLSRLGEEFVVHVLYLFLSLCSKMTIEMLAHIMKARPIKSGK